MTEQRRETIAYIQIEVSRICQLVEIEEWLVAPQIGIEGIYTPEALKIYTNLLLQEGLQESEAFDPDKQLIECQEETDRICTMLDIVQYLKEPTDSIQGTYSPEAQKIFDDAWEKLQ